MVITSRELHTLMDAIGHVLPVELSFSAAAKMTRNIHRIFLARDIYVARTEEAHGTSFLDAIGRKNRLKAAKSLPIDMDDLEYLSFDDVQAAHLSPQQLYFLELFCDFSDAA